MKNLELELKHDIENAPENLIAEAHKILSEDYTPSAEERKRVEKLKELGFDQFDEVRKPIELKEAKERMRRVMERAEYYSRNYTYKFIDEKAVERICKKYGLYLATASDYTADIPVKNQKEIIDFRVLDEDIRRPNEVLGMEWSFEGLGSVSNLFNSLTPPIITVGPPRRENGLLFHDWNRMEHQRRSLWDRIRGRLPDSIEPQSDESLQHQLDAMSYMVSKLGEPKESGTKKPVLVGGQHLLIIAPEDKLAESSRREKVGHIYKINDPIVLQPVKEGYLIITAWGLEASDAEVQNPLTN